MGVKVESSGDYFLKKWSWRRMVFRRRGTAVLLAAFPAFIFKKTSVASLRNKICEKADY
jgi:hypothetical protein